MGEASGLEALAKIAPVQGVVGADDQPSPYTDGRVRVIHADGLAIGCVFDPVAAGLATGTDPLTLAGSAEVERILGAAPDVLLWASTHVPSVGRNGAVLLVNPGSATLPAEGSAASFARLTIAGGGVSAEIVDV